MCVKHTYPGLIKLKKHIKHTRHTRLQLEDYYKKVDFKKSKREKELIRQRVRTPGGSCYRKTRTMLGLVCELISTRELCKRFDKAVINRVTKQNDTDDIRGYTA